MGFLKRIKDVASGRISKINYLFGNHGLRIVKKLDANCNGLLYVITGSTSICTIEFLEILLYEVDDFKYDDGTVELNPFRQNIKLLNTDNSILMYKLVASNYFSKLFSKNIWGDFQDSIPELKTQLFTIFEFDDENISIFNELSDLSKKDQKPSAEFRLYKYIFEKVYKIEVPLLAYHMMNFEIVFAAIFNESFMPMILNSKNG